MMMSLGTVVLLAQSALGGHGHHGPKEGVCDACGVESQIVLAEIQCLQANPKARKREGAAKDLRKIDWHCHPEIVTALAMALLHDCKDDVREEAAESLGKLAPCLPEAHEALAQAATVDPDHGVRRHARKALAKMTGRCEAACQVCGSGPTVIGPPRPIGPPVLVPGDQPPARIVVPPDLGPLEPAPAEPALPPPLPDPPPTRGPSAGDIPLEPPLEPGGRPA